MKSVKQKTIGMLIDELITADIKCFMAQDVLMQSKDKDAQLKAALTAQEQNSRRNKLIQAIDEILKTTNESPSTKTY